MPVDVIPAQETRLPTLMAGAVFENEKQAEAAFILLQQAGIDARRVSFLQRKGEVLAALEPASETDALIREDERLLAENPVMGAVSGAAIGGAAGWLVGLGLIAIPGIGPFLAAGTLATLAASATVGAVAGGLGGALLLWGVPDDIAHHYARQLEGRRCLLLVESQLPEEQAQVVELLERAGGQDINTFTREDTTNYTPEQ